VIEIKMPRLSDTMEEGAISTWRKHPGDAVAVGDVLVEIETDKAVMEYEAYQAGTLAQILVPEGRNADIGVPIALLDDGTGAPAPSAATPSAEPSPERQQATPSAPATPEPPAPARAASTPAANGSATEGSATEGSATEGSATEGSADGGSVNGGSVNGSGRQLASPLVRKLARENHLDLSHVQGTGPGGRIIRADLTNLLDTGRPSPSPATAPAPPTPAAAAPDAPGTAAAVPAAPASAAPASLAPVVPAPSAAAVPAAPATASAPSAAAVPAADATASAPSAAAVPAALAAPATAPAGPMPAAPLPAGTTDDGRGTRMVPVSQVRRVIARRLSASAREIPHFYVTAVAEAQDLMDLRATLNAQLTEAGRAKVSVNDLLIRACALALREHPDVNVSYGGDTSSVVLVHDRVNVGVAVAAESGLIVPVIRDADTKTVTQLGTETRKLVALAAERKLAPAQTSGGTFTISNLGMYGVEHFTALINPPESAILAVGATTREPTVVGDTLQPRYRLRYTLSVDHRVIDGALAAKFLQTLTSLIEHPWMIVA
jgi:pyruvate dehydrogenase E2 component (dihydrolipoamide acetyltransferase)